MHSKEQLMKVWDQLIEAQVIALQQMRSSCPTARDTQGHLGNAVTFIGTDLMADSLPKLREVFFGLLEKPQVEAKAKNDNQHDNLSKLGIQQ